MAKRSGMFKFEKRKKEVARQKKQEEKRLRRQGKKDGGEGPPVASRDEIDAPGFEDGDVVESEDTEDNEDD